MVAAPLRDAAERAAETRRRRLPFHHPVALPASAPEVRESQQVEACRRPPARSGWTVRWLPELNQPGFLRVELQAVLIESLRKHVEDSASILLPLEEHDE